jgi:hypothetical protein
MRLMVYKFSDAARVSLKQNIDWSRTSLVTARAQTQSVDPPPNLEREQG